MSNEKDSAFDEAYEKFRREHINASFMPKEMALAMWEAGQASVIEALPSDEETDFAVEKICDVEFHKFGIDGRRLYSASSESKLQNAWKYIPPFKDGVIWLRSRLQEKITNREDGL